MNHRCTLQCSFWLLQVDNHLTATLMSTQTGLKRWWRGKTNHDDDHTHFVWNVFARNTGEATRVSSSRWLYKRQFQYSLGDHREKMITLKNQRTLCEHMATTYAVLEEKCYEHIDESVFSDCMLHWAQLGNFSAEKECYRSAIPVQCMGYCCQLVHKK